MDNVPARPALPTSFQAAVAAQQEAAWRDLGQMTVGQAATAWLASLENAHTRKNYHAGLLQLQRRGLFHPGASLQEFALANHEATLDRIKEVDGWSEATRQARAALFCGLTRFLARRTGGVVRKASPSREGAARTFFRVRDQVDTKAMTELQCRAFLRELDMQNARDALIAKLMLQGGKRRSEVLALTADQIDWDLGQITFKQLKTRGVVKEVIITYPRHVMSSLKTYLGERDGLVFVTSRGLPVRPTQVARSFRRAGRAAAIPFAVHPHVLRTSTVTIYKAHGAEDSDIMKVTGHASAQMVAMYDRSDRADNVTKRINLV